MSDLLIVLVVAAAAIYWWNRHREQRETSAKPRTSSSPATPHGQVQQDDGRTQTYKLAGGQQICLGVNMHSSEEVDAKLIGRKRDEYVEKTVSVFMFRDTDSQYKDSVRVELPTGELIGWVLKSDSALACKVIDSLSKKRSRSERAIPLRLQVSMRVEGEASTDDGELIVDIHELEIRIKDPVKATIVA